MRLVLLTRSVAFAFGRIGYRSDRTHKRKVVACCIYAYSSHVNHNMPLFEGLLSLLTMHVSFLRKTGFVCAGAVRLQLPPMSALRAAGFSADCAKHAVPTVHARRITLTFRRLSADTKAFLAGGKDYVGMSSPTRTLSLSVPPPILLRLPRLLLLHLRFALTVLRCQYCRDESYMRNISSTL
jgi:hypothetical protein